MSVPKPLSMEELAVFERATEIMAANLAFFRDETSEPNENDRLTAGHLAGGLWANGLLAKATPASAESEQPMSAPKNMQAQLDKSNLALLAVEYGYKACERGESLQAALSGALRLLAPMPTADAKQP